MPANTVWLVVREYESGGERGTEVIAVAATEDVAERIAETWQPGPRDAPYTVEIDWHERTVQA